MQTLAVNPVLRPAHISFMVSRARLGCVETLFPKRHLDLFCMHESCPFVVWMSMSRYVKSFKLSQEAHIQCLSEVGVHELRYYFAIKVRFSDTMFTSYQSIPSSSDLVICSRLRRDPQHHFQPSV